MKKRNWLLLGLIISFLIPFSLIKAAEIKTDNFIALQKGEFINSNFYATGGEIRIDGNIAGDLFAIAEKITINGEIGGDLIVIASKIEINGVIGGNVRVIASEVYINGEIKRNASLIAGKLNFEKSSLLNWDLLSLSEDLTLNGNINPSAKYVTITYKGEVGKSDFKVIGFKN